MASKLLQSPTNRVCKFGSLDTISAKKIVFNLLHRSTQILSSLGKYLFWEEEKNFLCFSTSLEPKLIIFSHSLQSRTCRLCNLGRLVTTVAENTIFSLLQFSIWIVSNLGKQTCWEGADRFLCFLASSESGEIISCHSSQSYINTTTNSSRLVTMVVEKIFFQFVAFFYHNPL